MGWRRKRRSERARRTTENEGASKAPSFELDGSFGRMQFVGYKKTKKQFVEAKAKLNAGVIILQEFVSILGEHGQEVEILMEMTKQQYWDQIICCGPNNQHRRLVLKRDLEAVNELIEVEPDYGVIEQKMIESYQDKSHMFVPIGPDDDFNLVTSLCTDGLHRPVFDIDFPKEQVQLKPPGKLYITHGGARSEVRLTDGSAGPMIPVGSTTNLHVYVQEAMTYADYCEKLATVPGEDAAKYRSNVVRMGYGALRPPWVRKSDPPQPITDWEVRGLEAEEEPKKGSFQEIPNLDELEKEWERIKEQAWKDRLPSGYGYHKDKFQVEYIANSNKFEIKSEW